MAFVASPTNRDILCGKDKTFNKHPGNLLYRQFIEEHAVRYYQECSKQVKMKVTKDIVCQLESSGARFIRRFGDDGWQEITNQEARDKTSHALRFCAGSLAKKTKPPAVVRRPSGTTNSTDTPSPMNVLSSPPPIRRAVKRAAKAKREHRRIVSSDYNEADHPFINRLVDPMVGDLLPDNQQDQHQQWSSFVSAASSSTTMIEASQVSSLPDDCFSIHPSISLSSINEMTDDENGNDDVDTIASKGFEYYSHENDEYPPEEQYYREEERYDQFDHKSLVNNDNEYSSFLPDFVASDSYDYPPTTTTMNEYATMVGGGRNGRIDQAGSCYDNTPLEHIWGQEPFGAAAVRRDDDVNWDYSFIHHQNSY